MIFAVQCMGWEMALHCSPAPLLFLIWRSSMGMIGSIPFRLRQHVHTKKKSRHERDKFLLKLIEKRISSFHNGIHESISRDREFTLYLCIGFLSGVAGGINNSIFNNFLSNVFHLSESARGLLEFPRELPGFLVVFVLSILAFLGDTRIVSIAMFGAAIGIAGLGFSQSYGVLVLFLMIFSMGQHLYMPIASSMGMHLSNPEKFGARLAKYNAYNLSASLLGYAIVWAGFKYLHVSYKAAFIFAAFFYLFSAFTSMLMKKQEPHHKSFKLIIRKRYTLYYLLCIVNGARKQIFLTFAPWVLIQVYGIGPETFALYGVIVALVSILTRTLVGNAIDTLGERKVLSIEAVVLFLLCLGYSFAANIFTAPVALAVIAACYIIDSSTSAVDMARSTYMRKIALYPSDITHTLSLGITVDHMVSMSIPILGGFLWAAFGYQAVFLSAAVIAISNFVLSMKIRID